MILLSGHSLAQARRVPLEAMSLSLRERETTATITPADMEGIQLKSWMMDDTNPGKGIVYRVRDIDQNFNTDTYQVQLEHIISTLKDDILFGEIKTEDLAGKKGATTVTAKKAVQYVLARQNDWVLGEFDYTDSNPYKFDGETLFDAIGKVTDSLEDSIWTFDLSVYPFKLNIKRESDAVGTELRAGRNLRTLKKKISKVGMYTRFYPIGKDDLHLPGGGYVDKNTDKYGIISKTETDQSLDTVAELKRWAEEQLAKHAEPIANIDVEGVELADATGVSLDEIQICRKCRIPLPDFGTEMTERITGIDYPEKIRQPKVFRAMLASNKKDVTKVIADFMKRSGGGGRAAAREAKERTAWILDTENKVGLCAKSIVGTDENGNPNWVRLTNLIVDEGGMSSTVQAVKEGLTVAETRIQQTENAIILEAKKRTDKDKELEGKITVQANKISLVVTQRNGHDIVNAASIVLGINNESDRSGSYIKLKAKTVDLGNYATVGQLDAVSGNFDKLVSGDTTATWLKANSMAANSFSVNPAGSFMFRSYAVSWKLLQYTDQNGSAAEMYVLGR